MLLVMGVVAFVNAQQPAITMLAQSKTKTGTQSSDQAL